MLYSGISIPNPLVFPHTLPNIRMCNVCGAQPNPSPQTAYERDKKWITWINVATFTIIVIWMVEGVIKDVPHEILSGGESKLNVLVLLLNAQITTWSKCASFCFLPLDSLCPFQHRKQVWSNLGGWALPCQMSITGPCIPALRKDTKCLPFVSVIRSYILPLLLLLKGCFMVCSLLESSRGAFQRTPKTGGENPMFHSLRCFSSEL